MKVLVVGCGSMGRRHAENAVDLGHDVAVYDEAVGPSAFSTYQSLNEALSWQPDAVVIATPVVTHPNVFAAVARRTSSAIFIEKPLACSVAAYRAPYNAPDDAPLDNLGARIVQIGTNWRFHPFVCDLRLRSKDVPAAPTSASFICSSRMASWPGQRYGDALLECGAHEIDTALALFGPARLAAAVRSSTKHAWRLDLVHDSGCQTQVAIFGDAEPFRMCRIRWPTHEGGYTVDHDDPRTIAALDASYKAELAYFLDVARGETPETILPAATLADGLAVLRIIDEARLVATEIVA